MRIYQFDAYLRELFTIMTLLTEEEIMSLGLAIVIVESLGPMISPPKTRNVWKRPHRAVKEAPLAYVHLVQELRQKERDSYTHFVRMPPHLLDNLLMVAP